MGEALKHTERFQYYRMHRYDEDTNPGLVRVQSSVEGLFKSNFSRLYAYAYTMLKDHAASEEMVQNVFLKIWEKKDSLSIDSSATAYLYKAVYHECLNYLRHEKVRQAYVKHVTYSSPSQTGAASAKVQLGELQQQIETALAELPEQCRTIFQMSRFEELRYQEIADRLGLSVKTIENQMSKALRILRLKLADYLPILLALILKD